MRSSLFAAVAVFGMFFALQLAGTSLATVDRCDAERLGQRAYGPLSTIYQVEAGDLAGICHGADDPVVYDAWANLTMFTTADERESIVGFGGFRNTSGRDVVAYATALNPDRTQFMIVVNLDMVEYNPWQVRRVMAHEYGHVLTRTAQGAGGDECGEFGCITSTNYMGLWVERFWTESELDSVTFNSYDNDRGREQRCQANAAFPTEYAATNPHEDFSESFEFFLYSNRVPASVQPRIQFLSSFPELVRMRDRVAAAGFADFRDFRQNCGPAAVRSN